MENLGNKIRLKREAKNLTIEELSKKTFLSVAVIKDIEAGKFDLYDGEETYVKMYLKKISDVLELDSYELTQSYYELTQEIKLAQLKEKEEFERKQNDVIKKGKTFNFDIPEYTRKKSVYEDKSHFKIIRSFIIFALVALIFGVVWWGISKAKSNVDNPTFNPQNQTTIEGDIPHDDITNDNQNDQTNQNIFNNDIKFEKNDRLDYSITVSPTVEQLTFKIVFGSQSWSSLKVNNKDYNDFDAKIYNNEEIVEVILNVNEFDNLDLKNGYSMGHKYYINDVEIPLSEDEYSEGVTHLKLKLVKTDDITE